MSANRFAHLATRVFNKPQLILERKSEVIVAALADRFGITSIGRINGDAVSPDFLMMDDDEVFDSRSPAASETYETRGYDVEMGVARIEISGTLVAKNGTLRPYSGMTGYDGIRQNFVEAVLDERVRAIMLAIDSPGGEVAGCFDLADLIYAARGRKPVWAVLDECAFSAAYAIASAADRITVPRTGGTGSIGVVWMHCDFSGALNDAGIKVTFVKRGARKVDGAPEIALSDEALASIQGEIDTIGEMFENLVARNRGLSTDGIREMNAATFLGAEGVSRGLADEVMAPDAAFRALVKSLGN